MLNSYEYQSGNLPILVSMPHNGSLIPEKFHSVMTKSALNSVDTDWFLDRLYHFVLDRGCHVIKPQYSRYVIDLNRPEDNANLYPGQNTTELCPLTQFDASSIYLGGLEPSGAEIEDRINHYWRSYHQCLKSSLDAIRADHGIALLFDAHSIKSRVPRFFDGQLADFNFGNLDNQTCSNNLTKLLEDWEPKGYSKVINGRFKGGYITRAYAMTDNNIHSLQLEISQATYMNEKTLSYDEQLAAMVIQPLNEMFDLFEQFVRQS